MSLASRCREAISHVAMLKKELACNKKWTSEDKSTISLDERNEIDKDTNNPSSQIFQRVISLTRTEANRIKNRN